MQKRTMNNESKTAVKAGRIEQACARYGLGKNTMRKIASEAGAELKIGKCYLINFSKMDAYIDNLTN